MQEYYIDRFNKLTYICTLDYVSLLNLPMTKKFYITWFLHSVSR